MDETERREYWQRARNADDFALWIHQKRVITFYENWTVEPREERLKVLTERLEKTLTRPAFHANEMINRWPTASLEHLTMAANFLAITMMFNADPHDTDIAGTGIALALYFYLSI